MKIRRAQYVMTLWNHATTASPGDGLSPTNYGWFTNKDGRLQPIWFEGPAAPSSLFGTTDNTDAGTEIDSDSDETIITGIDEDLHELSDADDGTME